MVFKNTHQLVSLLCQPPSGFPYTGINANSLPRRGATPRHGASDSPPLPHSSRPTSHSTNLHATCCSLCLIVAQLSSSVQNHFLRRAFPDHHSIQSNTTNPTQRSSPLSLLFFSLETHRLPDRKLYFIRSVHCVTSLLQPKLPAGVKPCPLHQSITSSKKSASREGRYSIDRLIKGTNHQVK